MKESIIITVRVDDFECELAVSHSLSIGFDPVLTWEDF